MKYWLLLLAAGVLQTVWIIALRKTEGFTRIGPIAVYAFVGLATTLCLSRAFEGIPEGTAYTVWMGVSILGSAVIDMMASKSVDLPRAFCILLILAGAAGLKLAEKPEPNSARPDPALGPGFQLIQDQEGEKGIERFPSRGGPALLPEDADSKLRLARITEARLDGTVEVVDEVRHLR